MTATSPASLRELLGQWHGVRFTPVGENQLYTVFDADLSPCVALAGADALTYMELRDATASAADRAAVLRESLNAGAAPGRTIVVEPEPLPPEVHASLDGRVAVLPASEVPSGDRHKAAERVRHSLRDGVPLETLVLYRYLGAVTGSRFFGRNLQVEALLKKHTEAYLVTGARMSGKSSLLLEALRRITAGQSSSAPTAVYLDLKRYYDIPSMISAILLGLNKRESITYSKKWPPSRWPELFRILRKYARDLPGRRLILFLDEFDRLIDLDQGVNDTMQWSMRSLHQENSAAQGWVQFVIAGSKRLAKLAANQDSALHNFVNAEECRLTNFNVGTIREVITGPMEALGLQVPDPQAVAQEVLRSSAGRPSSVQYLCDRAAKELIRAGEQVLTTDVVQEVVRGPLYLEYYQKQVFENTDALAQFVLAAFAKENWFRAEDLQKQLERHGVHVHQGAVLNTLTDLANSGFLIERQGVGSLLYEVATPVLSKIFAATPQRRYVDDMLQQGLATRRS